MICKILQIDMFSLHDTINTLDWSEAAKQYPAVDAYLKTSLNGSKSYTPDMAVHYQVAEIVDVPDLDSCFVFCNGMPVKGAYRIHRERPRSLSVGDMVIEVTAEGERHYMVDPVGFTAIQVPD